jgi:hypothetical protein
MAPAIPPGRRADVYGMPVSSQPSVTHSPSSQKAGEIIRTAALLASLADKLGSDKPFGE